MLQGTVPRKDIRDTAVHPPLMSAAREGAKLRARKLRQLALDELGATIQSGEHSAVDDARAAMYIYQKHRVLWDAGIKSGLYKVKGLKASGRIARGDFRQMALRAGPFHTAWAGAAKGIAGFDGLHSDDEFAGPTAVELARMKQRMAEDRDDDE
jgi:hypothetical protein